MSSRTILLLMGIALIGIACGNTSVNGGEDYGNILNNPQGLVLTEDVHRVGWGRADCTTCHNLENIHLVNRTGVAIDIAQIHTQAIENGIAGCSACHGANGVQ